MLELIWWLLAIGGSCLVILPIYLAQIPFDWLVYNLLFVLGGITLVRYVFTFQHHPLAASRIFKVLLIFLAPVLFFPILEGLHSFLEFNDREGLQSIMGHLSLQRQNWFIQYIRFEYIIAGVTCLIGIFALIIKMIRSLWRQYRFNEI